MRLSLGGQLITCAFAFVGVFEDLLVAWRQPTRTNLLGTRLALVVANVSDVEATWIHNGSVGMNHWARLTLEFTTVT